MLFAVGKVRVSKQVLEDEGIPVPDIVYAFGRYIRGDWGDLASDQEIANDIALASGGRIMARYRLVHGKALVMTTAAGETVISASEAAGAGGVRPAYESAVTEQQRVRRTAGAAETTHTYDLGGGQN